VCELYYGFLDSAGEFADRKTQVMQAGESRDSERMVTHYQATLEQYPRQATWGSQSRVVPLPPALWVNRYSLGLIAWGIETRGYGTLLKKRIITLYFIAGDQVLRR